MSTLPENSGPAPMTRNTSRFGLRVWTPAKQSGFPPLQLLILASLSPFCRVASRCFRQQQKLKRRTNSPSQQGNENNVTANPVQANRRNHQALARCLDGRDGLGATHFPPKSPPRVSLATFTHTLRRSQTFSSSPCARFPATVLYTLLQSRSYTLIHSTKHQPDCVRGII